MSLTGRPCGLRSRTSFRRETAALMATITGGHARSPLADSGISPPRIGQSLRGHLPEGWGGGRLLALSGFTVPFVAVLIEDDDPGVAFGCSGGGFLFDCCSFPGFRFFRRCFLILCRKLSGPGYKHRKINQMCSRDRTVGQPH